MIFGNGNLRGRQRRIAELAGMIKEAKQGKKDKLQEVLAKFSIKEGVTEDIANGYLDLLVKSKLVVFQFGEENWKYNSEVEVEIFGVNL